MGRILLVITILLALVMALFGAQNPQPVRIEFFNMQTGPVPLYVVILISALAGVVLTILASLRGRIAQSLHARKLEKRITELEKELQIKSSAMIVDVPDRTPVQPAPVKP